MQLMLQLLHIVYAKNALEKLLLVPDMDVLLLREEGKLVLYLPLRPEKRPLRRFRRAGGGALLCVLRGEDPRVREDREREQAVPFQREQKFRALFACPAAARRALSPRGARGDRLQISRGLSDERPEFFCARARRRGRSANEERLLLLERVGRPGRARADAREERDRLRALVFGNGRVRPSKRRGALPRQKRAEDQGLKARAP